eukprot:CAMPEP_0168591482 /NCGR_PEP_ID=MMETSP0420-20121227/7163_1 /TAXON_ID=498008 /ORGANISM="Pessonella sp." /LENGTH=712 /DNA_ID=CAMNT_0008627287 /DNA_START=55 /DNA_END=2193 /DNA_ORIENTATION=+
MSSLLVPVGVAAVGAAGVYVCLSGGTSPVATTKRDLKTIKQSPQEVPAYEKNSKHYHVEPDAEGKIRLAQKGIAAKKPTTVMQQFALAVKKNGDSVALRVERDGKWIEWTWKEYFSEVEKVGRALIHLGLEQHESVCIIGFNSPEWFFANMGAIAAGGKAAGIYTTNEADACQYIAEHSQSRVAVVENEVQLEKFLKIRDQLPKLKAIVMYTGDVPEKVRAGNANAAAPVYSWKEFVAFHAKTPAGQLATRIEAQRPGHGCTLIYTSGTTGRPKAVMVSHDNLTWTPQSLFEVMDKQFGHNEEHIVSYLPLSHIAAQILDIHAPIAAVALRGGSCTVHFARPDALKGTLGDTLRAARPTVFFGVPRVWEKIAEKMKAMGAATKASSVKTNLVAWAKSCGAAAYEAEAANGSNQLPWGYPLAHKLVLSKVRMALGLDRCKICYTGAAPISPDVLNYFGSLHIPVLELYGMSECTGPQTVSSPGCYKVGSCGPSLPGVELKIDHDPSRDAKGEGEICYRGRHIMLGYMRNEQKSKEAIDPDGWLHSGDVGRLDEDGFLFITGRIKELIITAGGENVAPVPIESLFKSHCPGVSNIMMIGDKRKYNTAIITLKVKPDPKGDGSFTNELDGDARAVDDAVTTVDQARKSKKWDEYITNGLKQTNAEAVSRAARIQKYRIVDGDFSVPGGELTSTLKLRRSVAAEKYNDEIEEMYNE